MTDESHIQSTMTYRVRLVAIAVCSSGLGAALLILFPSIFWSIFKGPETFFPQTMHDINSPDDRYRIVVKRRIHFPVTEILDSPSANITVLLKTAEDVTIQEASFDIHESSELQEPLVQWSNNEVTVDDIEYHQEIGLRFRLHY